jgi:hypothetical protein
VTQTVVTKPPAVWIELAVEAAPIVLTDAANDSEADRLMDWIASKPGLLDLVSQALELEEQAA